MTALAYCPADDLARGACRTLGACWGHECVGFADCPCARCCHKRRQVTDAHPNHSHVSDASYCGACRTAGRERNYRDVRDARVTA
jgi:hypothetical protein